jgi:hypothetical protein
LVYRCHRSCRHHPLRRPPPSSPSPSQG